MDDIILNGDPFDGDENTSQEDKRARERFAKKRAKPAEGLANREALRNGAICEMIAVSSEPLLDIGVGPIDPFTCYVQEILAKTIFRNNIPSEGPDKERDSPELYRDKQTFHRAVTGAKRFREETLGPLLERLAALLEATLDAELVAAITRVPRLVVHTKQPDTNASDWSGTARGATVKLEFFNGPERVASLNVLPAEAEYIKALHNVFHLEKYVIAVLLDSLRSANIENYTQSWIAIATPDYAAKPIQQWEELTFIPFVDYMLALWLTVKYFEDLEVFKE